ncbi:CPBP family intramembrane glutamic endopeptidase [Staphylococcus petrasii]|uniref:CPBP family intramembrane glutamic endopeptidase n=1 Tax=Staphylococcus petrasii TaxID=1276936 RepID=UPI001F59EAD5|nr:type II CAAX endopeptidase family protein [Staphylococcus petrasii]MCI2773898.1 CPBP family intramembrane metalloprotease [Staphylococcus petrasii]
MSLLNKSIKIISVTILTFILTVVAQNIAILWHLINLHSFETVLHAITYVILTFVFVKLVINKLLKDNLANYRINKVQFNKSYIIIGLPIPLIMFLIFICFVPGHFEMTQTKNTTEYLEMLFEIIVLGGICAPIAEELTVRGLLMGYIEKKTNITVAIIITSILFASVHLFNGWMSGVSLILLLTSGTIAGILYGLTAYKFKSIWASAFLHICWNMADLLHVTTHNENYGVIQYITKTNNILITGGDYGNSASVISIVIFLIAIIFLLKIPRATSQ